MKRLILFLALAALNTTAASAATTQDGPIFTISEGVNFELGNVGASDFQFSWTDPGGGLSFSDEVDPTLILTAGETYTFLRTTSAHPFIIMDSSAAAFIDGSDGSYSRTTTNGGLLDAATLDPIPAFTADPAPSGDVITWTPTVGDYWYSCRVTGHLGMTGRIQVVPEPGSAILGGLASLGLLGRRLR